MKNLALTIVVAVFSLTACSTQKKLMKNAPFTTNQAVCYDWVGGRAESGSGVVLEIPIRGELVGAMEFKEAFLEVK